MRILDANTIEGSVGIRAGRIVAGALPSQSLLDATLAQGAAKGYRLLFWTVDTGIPGDPKSATTAHRLRDLLRATKPSTCQNLTYRIDLNASVLKILGRRARGVEVVSFSEPEATSALIDLAVICGTQSQFGTDPNISRSQFCAVYRAWVAEAVDGTAADEVLVLREAAGKVVGMVAVRAENGAARIVLCSVDPQHGRRGYGTSLVGAACEWAWTRGLPTCLMTSEVCNLSARALCEGCGGVPVGGSTDVHFWMPGAPPDDLGTSQVPLNRPYITGREAVNVMGVLAEGRIDTHSAYGRACEQLLERELGVTKALLVGSGTGALELCARTIGAGPGAEIIVPSYTFVSTANAFVTCGATPVLVDVRADTQNLDETKVEAAITDRTIAICCVHYGGVPCEMDSILAIARRHGLYVIEDAAHALYGSYKGRPLGSIGNLAALSFHYTKNIVCGEGGAVLINEPTLVRPAHVAWEKGTNRFDYLSGKVDKYYWVEKGGSFVMSEILAAVLHAQLEAAAKIQEQRHAIWARYHARLESLERAGKLVRPQVPVDCVHAAHLYYVRVPDVKDFERLGALAKEQRISIFTHYLPLHLSQGATKYARSMACTEAVACANQLYRLPMWVGLSDKDIDRVIAVINGALGAGHSD